MSDGQNSLEQVQAHDQIVEELCSPNLEMHLRRVQLRVCGSHRIRCSTRHMRFLKPDVYPILSGSPGRSWGAVDREFLPFITATHK